MKMQLNSMRIIKAGPIDDIFIDFTDKIFHNPLSTCIIAGANGSGKTTILELIAQLPELFCPQRKDKILKVVEYVQIDWLIDTKTFSLCYGKKPADASINALENLCYFAPSYDRKEKGSIARRFHSILHKDEHKQVRCKDLEDIKNIDLPTIIYFPFTRFISNVSGKQINQETIIHQLVNRIEPSRHYSGSYSSYLTWLDYAEPVEYQAVIDFMNNIDLDGKTYFQDRQKLSTMIKLKSGEIHRLNELSSGEQNLFIILLELKRRLVNNSIVLIDEIENSLHPAFQQKLAYMLSELQKTIPFQLIITTHSPEFIKTFGSDKLRLLNQI